MVDICEHVPDAEFCECLSVSGSMLLCGGKCWDDAGFVAVLDSKTMDHQHTVWLDHRVKNLLSVRGNVWGKIMDGSVVVWGKAEQGEGSGMSKVGGV